MIFQKKIAMQICFLVLLVVSGANMAEENITSHSDSVFIDASKMLGNHLVVKGRFHWQIENKNLFPLGTDVNDFPEGYCLPILIKNSDKKLIKIAKKLDGSNVIISGKIIDPAPPGMLSMGGCKKIGIDVISIQKLED